jgi:murein DD-endopeptidase MepM/ murein hydrolase activator NlpD
MFMPFPLPFVPAQSYKTGGRRFGADRDHGKRKHAGCDLIAPLGTPIFAVDDGVVMEAAEREFYRGTFAVAIQHHGYVVRYCEVKSVAPGIRRGSFIRAGTVIAFVGKMFVSSMLHFELYRGPYGAGGLTNRKNKPFQRRADLQDPTHFLNQLALHVLQSHEPVTPTASS